MEEVRHQLKISQEKLTLVQAGSSSGSGMVDSEKVVDLQSQVNALKNETLKLKEHLSKARQATNQVNIDFGSCNFCTCVISQIFFKL